VETAGFNSMHNSQNRLNNDSLHKENSTAKNRSLLQRHSFENERSYQNASAQGGYREQA